MALATPLHGVPYHAVRALTPYLTAIYEKHPIEGATDEYYAYCFLFSQLQRVSLPCRPTMTTMGVWQNLLWVPIRGLLAWTPDRELDDTRMGGAWRAWYYQHVLTQHATATQLLPFFPWIPPVGEPDPAVVRRQAILLWQLMEETDQDAGDLLHTFDPSTRRVRPGSAGQWHPWLVISRPEAWDRLLPYDTPRCRDAIARMLSLPELWQTWYTGAPFVLADLNVSPQTLLPWLDRYVELVHGGRQSHSWKRWRTIRRRLNGT